MRRSGKTFLVMGICLVAMCLLVGCAAQAKPKMPTHELTAHQGMFDLYEENRKQGVPNYITEDFIILAYRMAVNRAVTQVEEAVLLPKFEALVAGLIAKLRAVKSPTAIQRANLDYLAVIDALLHGKNEATLTPDSKPVTQELALIREAKSAARSPLMLQLMDYSQFQVRAKYTRSKKLSRYFQAMKYAGTVLFPVQESKATGINASQADLLTAQAVDLIKMIAADATLFSLHQEINQKLTAFFGPPDDLRLADYCTVAANHQGDMPALRKALLAYAREHGRRPKIISGIVDQSALEKGLTAADVITGWRLISSRFAADSAVFQQLVYDQVGVYQSQARQPFSLAIIEGKPVKGFPLGLELMALLGSREAAAILKKTGDTDYQGYAEAADRARDFVAKNDGANDRELAVMSYWLNRGTQPDGRRRLNSCLAWWALNRHSSILYAKQSYTLAGKGMALIPPRKTAWLEPAPELYAYLAVQARVLNRGVGYEPLAELARLLERCRTIAAKEALGQGLSPADVEFLNGLDRRLLKVTGEKDKPVVADVHTEPTSRQVVQVAVGRPRVVTHTVGKLEARGALFTYYEFKQPMAKRLTDRAWQGMLADPKRMNDLKLSPSVVWRN